MFGKSARIGDISGPIQIGRPTARRRGARFRAWTDNQAKRASLLETGSVYSRDPRLLLERYSASAHKGASVVIFVEDDDGNLFERKEER